MHLPLLDRAGAVLALSLLAALPAHADDNDALKVSGFFSLVGGRASGSLGSGYSGPTRINGENCPCYTADWSNGGVYTSDFSMRPESRAGLQMKYKLSPEWSAVGQITTRAIEATPDLQWAYLSYTPNRNIEIQVGRKRIPIYYYSDFQDVGASYPWVTPPPELYGWEATNFNGASVRFKQDLGDANLSASLFTGRETVKDSGYMQLYYDGKTEVSWKKLLGADLEFSRGPLTVRGVYVQADATSRNPGIALDTLAKLKAYGLAVNLDLDDWFILSELTQLKRDFSTGYSVKAPAYTLGAGYRHGAWTPFLNYAKYKEESSDLKAYAPQAYDRWSLTLRYDIDPQSAVKAQFDKARDVTRNFGGDTRVLRIAYDRLF